MIRMPATADSPPDDRVWFRPVIPLLFSFIAGIILALLVPVQCIRGQWIWVIFAAVPALGMIIRALVLNRNARFSPLFLFACLGYVAYSACVAGPGNPNHVAHYTDGRSFHITGTIDSAPVIQSYRRKCLLRDLELAPVSGTSPPFPVRGKIQVNIYGKDSGKNEALSLGDRITLTGEIRPFRSFHNPGGFDYTRYMAWHDVWGAFQHQVLKLIACRLIPKVSGHIWRQSATICGGSSTNRHPEMRRRYYRPSLSAIAPEYRRPFRKRLTARASPMCFLSQACMSGLSPRPRLSFSIGSCLFSSHS
jgi:hypothetical protein